MKGQEKWAWCPGIWKNAKEAGRGGCAKGARVCAVEREWQRLGFEDSAQPTRLRRRGNSPKPAVSFRTEHLAASRRALARPDHPIAYDEENARLTHRRTRETELVVRESDAVPAEAAIAVRYP